MNANFEDFRVLGDLPLDQAADKLRQLGAEDLADEFEEAWLEQPEPVRVHTFASRDFTRPDLAFLPTSHVVGYLDADWASRDPAPIKGFADTEPDRSLIEERITVSLDGLRVAKYPGKGDLHHLLFGFASQSVSQGRVDHLHFNATYDVREGERAGVAGHPIFVGLKVSVEGVWLSCMTIEVQKKDLGFLKLLDSGLLRSGLQLVPEGQPALALYCDLSSNLTRAVALRNLPIQKFDLGLDFSRKLTSGRLKEGSYIAVQVYESDQAEWNWKKWAFNPNNGCIVRSGDFKELIPHNYIIIGVQKSESR